MPLISQLYAGFFFVKHYYNELTQCWQ